MNNKIKALLMLSGKTLTLFGKFIGKSQSGISNKVARESWTLSDAISLAEYTGTRLAFIDEHGNPVITFDKDDLKKAE